MHAAIRPYATAAVALVGASVIAVTPITPTPPDIRVASPAVQLTAAPNPFEFYSHVASAAFTNISQLTRGYLAEPFPIIQAIAGLPVTSPVDISQAWSDVWASISFNVYSVVLEGFMAVYYVGNAEGPTDLLNAIIDIPAHIANGLLNGATEPDMVFCPCSGLLNPGYLGHGVPAADWPGFLGALIALDRAVGAAISGLFHRSSSMPARVDEPPTSVSTTLTLTTGATPNGLLDTFITRHPAVGAAFSGLFHRSSSALAPVNEPPTPGSTTLTVNTGFSLDSGATTADQDFGAARTDASTRPMQRLTHSIEGSDAASALDAADANAPDQANHDVGTVRDAAHPDSPTAATDLSSGNPVAPDQGAPTDPAEHAPGVLAHVRGRVEERTSHAHDGLTNAINHVDNRGPSGRSASHRAAARNGR